MLGEVEGIDLTAEDLAYLDQISVGRDLESGGVR